MKFYSTEKESNTVSFRDALLKGMPSDNGLYMPEYIPDLSNIFRQENNLTFQEISLLIASKFIDKELSNFDIGEVWGIGIIKFKI